MTKKLDSILSMAPPATVKGVELVKNEIDTKEDSHPKKLQRLVAVVPHEIKEQVKKYIANHPGDTERTVILRGLKAIGIDVDESLFIDRRSCR